MPHGVNVSFWFHKSLSVLLVLLPMTAMGCFAGSSPDDNARGASPQLSPPSPVAQPMAWAASHAPDKHWFGSVEGSVTARNRTQGLLASLSEGALMVWPDADHCHWRATLRWVAMGRGEQLAPTPKPAEPQQAGNRGSYFREGWGEEWFLNEPNGIEQGFVIGSRPQGHGGRLTLEVKVEGSLAPSLSKDGGHVLLRDEHGLPLLRYSNLVATDARGTVLPSTMAVHRSSVLLHVDDRGAQYPVTIDPLLWRERRRLMANDAQAGDYFGASVSVSGDTAIVGAPLEDEGGQEAGAAYIFYRHEGGSNSWGQIAKLTANDAQGADYFGHPVSVSGDTAIVGACRNDEGGADAGAAYIFYRHAGGNDSWGQIAKLVADDAQAGDNFGCALSISGDTVVVGAVYKNGGTGAAYVFYRNEGGADTWGQIAKLTAGDAQANDSFGQSVSIDGDTAIVGARWEDEGAPEAGAAYIFYRHEGGNDSWGQKAKLVANDAQSGDSFGYSVSISGDTVLVGALFDDDEGTAAGAAYVFYRNEGGDDTWGQIAKLTASDAQPSDVFGYNVSISKDTALVGAYSRNEGAYNTGAAYLFHRNEGGDDTWGQVAGLRLAEPEKDDFFGCSVAVSDDTALVGAWGDNDAAEDAGSALVFLLAHAEGDACTANSECHSGVCVDDVCCSEECKGRCMACSSSLTEGGDGECTFVSSGLDPDHDCMDGEACDGQGRCKLLLGEPCQSSGQCLSDHCVDEVCCNSPCDGSCEACIAAIVGRGPDGHCQPTAQGTDPDNDCEPDTSSLCGADGMCNGAGQCRPIAPQGTPCGESTCEEGVELLSPRCDGDGVCEEPAQRDCFPFACSPAGDACLSFCKSNEDCAADTHCNSEGGCIGGGTCLDQDTSALPQGETMECAPYICSQETGSCLDRCVSTIDCTEGFLCTSDARCVPASGGQEPGDSCSCSLPGYGRSQHRWLLGLAVLAGALLRRRCWGR